MTQSGPIVSTTAPFEATGKREIKECASDIAPEDQMAEFVFRIIGAAIEAAIDALIASTGKKVLSLCGVKSNLFVEVLIGLIFGRLSVSCWRCLSPYSL
jgi:hypothetical protein